MIYVEETEPIGELEAPFPPQNVQVKKAKVRDFYTLEKEIGRGKFGVVYECREKATGLRLAAKFVSASKKADRLAVEREIEIMKSLIHPKLIQLYDAYDDGLKEMCLILELIEGGELFDRVIDDDFVLTEKACAIFVRQIVEGVNYMHTQSILHLDMKPENILCISRTGNRIKLIDFGLARRYDPKKKLQVLFGTPEFVAPEVVNFEQIGYGTDIWSIGVIAYVLLSGLSPFMGDSDVETMANVTIARYDYDDEAFDDISEEAKDFISKLLVKEIGWVDITSGTATRAVKILSYDSQHCRSKTYDRNAMSTTSLASTAYSRGFTFPVVKDEVPPLIAPPPFNQETTVMFATSDIKNDVKTVEVVSNNNEAAIKVKPTVPPKPKKTKEELDITKENLKHFVERWNSHPNSPYIFDSPRRSISTGCGLPLPPITNQASRSSIQVITPSPRSSVSSVFETNQMEDFRHDDFTSAADLETENLLRTVQETLTKIETSIKETCSSPVGTNWVRERLLFKERASLERYMSKQSSFEQSCPKLERNSSSNSRCSPTRAKVTLDSLTRDFEKLEQEFPLDDFKEHPPIQSKIKIAHTVTVLKVLEDATNELDSLVKQSEQILVDLNALEEHPPVMARTGPPPRKPNSRLISPSPSLTGQLECRTRETSVSSSDSNQVYS